ncbi:unnamed protein product [Schistosoma mattheei]|uniref:Clathrin adaptor alpha-adaptin appendage C-terminal subdomain domain-containing protein n=1 Tax=Schistosoma mattheei TaxID=31246 RepID=A0A3P7ZTP2_9TREM|nr:unnamed protein product [Schistosoma mattheei]
MDGIDPNPNNVVGAGIVVTSSQQVGVLLRLEPNTQIKVDLFFCYLNVGMLGIKCRTSVSCLLIPVNIVLYEVVQRNDQLLILEHDSVPMSLC